MAMYCDRAASILRAESKKKKEREKRTISENSGWLSWCGARKLQVPMHKRLLPALLMLGRTGDLQAGAGEGEYENDLDLTEEVTRVGTGYAKSALERLKGRCAESPIRNGRTKRLGHRQTRKDYVIARRTKAFALAAMLRKKVLTVVPPVART